MQQQDVKKSFLDRTRQDIQTIKAYARQEIWPYITDKNFRKNANARRKAEKKAQRFQYRTNISQQKHFIRAVESSNKSDLSLSTYKKFKKYRRAHSVLANPLLKAWRELSRQPFYIRIPVMAGMFFAAKTASLFAIPVVFAGIFGMAITNKLATRSLQNWGQALRQDSLQAPFGFYAQNGKLFHPMAKVWGEAVEISEKIALEAPVPRPSRPLWSIQNFDFENNRHEQARLIHATTYEAMMRNPDIQDKLSGDLLADAANCAVQLLFPHKNEQQVRDMIKGWSSETCDVLFSDKTDKFSSMFNKVAERDQLSKASLRDAIVFALSPFCMDRVNSETALGLLAGKVTVQDLRDMNARRAKGQRISKAEAREIIEKLHDNRFENLSFSNVVETVLDFDSKQKQLFDRIWKDSQYRDIFTYVQARDIIQNYDSWGGTALQIAGNDYARAMTGGVIFDLIEPTNEGWAIDYIDLLTDHPQASQAMQILLKQGQHEQVRDIVQKQGMTAQPELCALAGLETNSASIPLKTPGFASAASLKRAPQS